MYNSGFKIFMVKICLQQDQLEIIVIQRFLCEAEIILKQDHLGTTVVPRF